MTATYVTYSDLISRFDERDIQQLLIDDSSDGAVVDLSTNAKLAVALGDAEGEVLAALRKAGKYSEAILGALTGVDLAYFQRIICEIAMVHLLRRRPTFSPDALKAYEEIRRANIKELQDGGSVITADEPAVISAGLVNNDGPSVPEWENLNLWRDRSNYFPQRYVSR